MDSTQSVARPVRASRYGCRRASRPPRSALARGLLRVNGQELDVEVQRRVRRNSGTTGDAVGQRGWNHELSLLADLHAGDALIPALYDLTLAEREIERLVAVE